MSEYQYLPYWSKMFTNQSPHEEEAQILIDFLKQFKFHSVLELGSGQGHLSRKLKENFTCHLTGLDLIAGNKFLDAFIKQDVTDFKPQNIFDLIVTRNFLMHIKPEHINQVLFNLIRKSKRFVAVEYYPEGKPPVLANHNFLHRYPGLSKERINKDRVILWV